MPRLYFTAKAASNADEDDAEGSEASKGGNEAAREQMAIKKSRLQGQRPVVMSRAMRDFVGLDQVSGRSLIAVVQKLIRLALELMENRIYSAIPIRWVDPTCVPTGMRCIGDRRDG